MLRHSHLIHPPTVRQMSTLLQPLHDELDNLLPILGQLQVAILVRLGLSATIPTCAVSTLGKRKKKLCYINVKRAKIIQNLKLLCNRGKNRNPTGGGRVQPFIWSQYSLVMEKMHCWHSKINNMMMRSCKFRGRECY